MRRHDQTSFESLESRVVLSNAYYAWVGVEDLPGYQAEFGAPDDLVGVSDNGAYFWSDAAADPTNADETEAAYLVIEGQVRYLRDIPQLAGAAVAGINTEGVVFARDVESGGMFLFDLDSPTGEIDPLEPAEFDAPSGFDLNAASPLAITDSGGLLFDTDPDASFVTMWIAIDGRVTELWSGPAGTVTYDAEGFPSAPVALVDINQNNELIGYPDAGETPFLWTPEGGARDLGAAGLSQIGGLDRDGRIFAKTDGQLVIWTDEGVVGTLYWDSVSDGEQGQVFFAGGIDDLGRFVVHDRIVAGQAVDGSQSLDNLEGESSVFEWMPESADVNQQMTASGVLLVYAAIGPDPAGGWYRVIDNEPLVRAESGTSPIGYFEVADPSGMHADFGLTLGSEAEVFVTIHNADGGTTEYWISEDGSIEWYAELERRALPTRVIADPTTGATIRLTLIEGELSVEGSAGLGLNGVGREIVSAPTGFFRSGGRVVVAGLDADARLVLAYQTPGGAASADLSAHLDARGLGTPAFTDALGSFATPWGAMNIVGLDGSGQVHAVWWAPGMGSPLWTTSNLSAITGAPPLVGELVAEATPWGGMQIMGTDERGSLIGLWWSPATGQWRVTDLSAQVGGPALTPGTLAMEIGRFGAVNVVGIGETDAQLVTYWWTPNAGWGAKPVIEGGDAPALSGEVSYFETLAGEHHIVGTDVEGDVIHFMWAPGEDWSWQNLTEVAST